MGTIVADSTPSPPAPLPGGEGSRRSGGGLRYAWWISVFLLCAVLGGLIGLALKTENRLTATTNMPTRNYEDLAVQYLLLKNRTHDDGRTIATLQSRIQQIEQTLPSTAQTKLIEGDLARTQFLAGLTPVTGPGVIVTLNDSSKRFPDAPLAIQMTGIVHDTDILQTVNELKAAGAEAMAVNDQRIVATTAIRCAGPTVYINGVPQTPPYVIKAIGDGPTLAKALRLPQGIYDSLSGIDPQMIKIATADKLLLPAYDGPMTPKYARPAPASAAIAADTQTASVKE